MINLWDYCTVGMFGPAFYTALLVFSLIRLFRQIAKQNKAIWNMKDKINELGAWRDEDLNALVRLEQKVARIHGCKGCNQKKKAIK